MTISYNHTKMWLQSNYQKLKSTIKNRPAVLIAIGWILAILLVRLFVVSTMHQPGNQEVQPVIAGSLQGIVKWDGGYYLGIAQNGYDLSSPNPAFYPLFPFAIRILHSIGFGWILAGVVINAVAVIFAAQGLYRLTEIITKKKKIAALTVFAWLAFPSAHFLAAYYTEAVFTALAVWSLVFLLRNKYLPAILFAGLASGSRMIGIVLGAVIFYHYVATKSWRDEKQRWWVLAIPLSFTGIGLYWLWLYRQTGVLPPAFFNQMYDTYWPYMGFEPNIFATFWGGFLAIMKAWRSSSWIDEWVSDIFTKIHFFASWVIIALSAIFAWRKKLPNELVIYSTLMALLLILTGNFISHSRYILPVFPVFILIAMWLDKQAEWVRTLYFILSAIGLGAMLTLFANGYWVG